MTSWRSGCRRSRFEKINDAVGCRLLVSSVLAVEPLVVTLVLDPAATARFAELRSALFPAGRTAVGAHVTLFHAVPGALTASVLADVAAACARPGFPVSVDAVMALGRGAAFRLSSPVLAQVHRTLQQSWWESLTAQDRQAFRPHVTVQNKVSPAVARSTVQQLSNSFSPYEVHALGLAVWRYVGGPWEPVETVRFEGAPAAG